MRNGRLHGRKLGSKKRKKSPAAGVQTGAVGYLSSLDVANAGTRSLKLRDGTRGRSFPKTLDPTVIVAQRAPSYNNIITSSFLESHIKDAVIAA